MNLLSRYVNPKGVDPTIWISREDYRFAASRARRACWRIKRPVSWIKSARGVLLGLAVGLLAAFTFNIMSKVLHESPAMRQWEMPVLLVACLSCSAFSFWFLREKTSYLPEFRRELRVFGYDVCLQCGHWLRGLSQDVDHCPECGAEREDHKLGPPPKRKRSAAKPDIGT